MPGALLQVAPGYLRAEDLLERVWDEQADPFTNTVTGKRCGSRLGRLAQRGRGILGRLPGRPGHWPLLPPGQGEILNVGDQVGQGTNPGHDATSPRRT